MPPKSSKKSKKQQTNTQKTSPNDKTNFDKLSKIVNDFTKDLSITFPEYKYLWEKWCEPLEEEEVKNLHEYFCKMYPERFFDILYQNEEIFQVDGEINTFFLPNVEFKLLYHCENVTETTKNAIWKYLQLILFTLTSSLKHKENFGDSANLFDGIDESELQSKITEAVGGIGEFFKNVQRNNGTKSSSSSSSSIDSSKNEEQDSDGCESKFSLNDEEKEQEKTETEEGEPSVFSETPLDANNIFENLKGLFDGKIGKLAKELAVEMSEEFKDIFGTDGSLGEDMEQGDPKDIFKKLMKDPKKIMNLVQKLSTKLKSKFQSGEVNQEEMMSEATEFMKQFKSMGGANSDQFKEMFQNMTKGMGLGKNAKMDVNALNRMEKQMDARARIKRNLERKRLEQQQKDEQQKQSNIQYNGGKAVFRLDGEEKQEKSTKEDIDRIMREMNFTNELTNEVVGIVSKETKTNKKSNKKKNKG
jgi:hypothetical protein